MALPVSAAAPPRTRVYLCDGLTADDLGGTDVVPGPVTDMPVLWALAKRGRVALMNTAVAGPESDTAALLTLALGALAPTAPTDADIYRANEPSPEGDVAGVVFRRRTGGVEGRRAQGAREENRRAAESQRGREDSGSRIQDSRTSVQPQPSTLHPQPSTLFHLGIAPLTRRGLNTGLVGAAKPGAIRLAHAGTTLRPGERRAALLAVDGSGVGYTGEAAVTVRYAADRAELERLLAAAPVDRERVLVLSPRPPLDARRRWQERLTPVVLAGPGITPGLLTSPTTRTPGLVANIDVAPTLRTWLGAPVPPTMAGRPFAFAPSPDPAGWVGWLDRVTWANAAALTPVFVLLGVLAAVVGFGGLAALRLRPSLAPGFGFAWLVLMNMPLALLLAVPLVDWIAFSVDFANGLLAPRGYAFLTLALMLALAIGEMLLWWRGAEPPRWISSVLRTRKKTAQLSRHPVTPSPRHPFIPSPPHLVSILTVVVLLADAFFGQPLVRYSLLSSYQIQGIRYYGIGNEYMGMLVGFTLAAVFLGRAPAPLTALVFALVAFVLGFPRLGANAGGLVAAVVAFGTGWTLLRGRRATWPEAAFWAMAGLGAAFGMAALDRIMPSAAPSHIGGALQAAGARGYGYLLEIVARKLAMNARILLHPGVLAALAGIAAVAWLAGGTLRDRARDLAARRPDWARSLPAFGWGALAAFLFNDSGIVAAVFILGIFLACGLWYALSDAPPRQPHASMSTRLPFTEGE